MLKIKQFIALVWAASGIAISLQKSDLYCDGKWHYCATLINEKNVYIIIRQKGDLFCLSADDIRYFNKWSQMAFCHTVRFGDGYRKFAVFKKIKDVIGDSSFTPITDRTKAIQEFYS